ncbi:MAG: hypothetical protein V4650_16400 [Pseudomonadota bacterium]
MLHTANANWNASTDGYASVSDAPRFERAAESMAVSSLQTTALVEPQRSENVAMTTAPTFNTPASLYSMDTAVMALAFVAIWLMVLGGAMLARQLKLLHTAS